jgi:hypothetical protein
LLNLPFQEGNLSEQTSTTAAAGRRNFYSEFLNGTFTVKVAELLLANMVIQIFNVVMGSAYYR